jgi:pepF/M3 family oligoendopeptidase
MPALINIMQHHPDQATRKRAYEKEVATWETVQESLAAAMNGIKGTANTLNRRRGRPNAVQPSLDAARIDQATLDAMMGAMRDSFPAFRKYLKAKAKRLGHTGGLPWWDLMAPVGHSERSYSWDEAREFILGNFGRFSPRLMGLAKRAFERNWIDAEQRPGKRAGAFCAEIPLTDESRILCNFDGSLDQVSTIAHELGHAFHNECLVGKTPLNTLTPMTLAETASIFCETIIIDAALAQAKTADERLAILETELIGQTQVIVDITSRFIFEKEVFERRASAELSPEDLCDAMLRAQKETYGDGLDENYMHKYMWTWKPHYYSAGLSFYNFPYAFGLLFALGLYSIYQKRGAAFVPEYEQLLASTGEGNAADLAARFGINIRDKAFWQSSLDVIGAKIEQYVNL